MDDSLGTIEEELEQLELSTGEKSQIKYVVWFDENQNCSSTINFRKDKVMKYLNLKMQKPRDSTGESLSDCKVRIRFAIHSFC